MKLKDLLLILREKRNFDTNTYIDRKLDAINRFFLTNNLDAVVVGLSGGVDSALVFALLINASNKSGSPLKKILGLSMPIFGTGTTNQKDAVERALSLNRITNEKSHIETVDLSKAHEAYMESARMNSSAWAKGQLASIVRTPCIYYNAAILQSDGYRSVVAGTTNRDEGAYIGFFGKASDAMVDLQPIADIHKSEVYKVANCLSVPMGIIEATPAGDVWDGKVDEDMIGAPYWFLEMYLLIKFFGLQELVEQLEEQEKSLFDKYSSNIEEIHRKNAHKYAVGNPAHFIDVTDRKIPGGW